MDRFCLVAIMLFAIQRDMVDCSVVDVINAIDKYRGTMPRVDYLELVFSDALYENVIHDVSFGTYDKYIENRQFIERTLPFQY